jgi:flotillin
MSIGVISFVGVGIVAAIVIVTILALRRIVPTNQVHIVQRNNKTVSYGKDTENGNVYYEIPSWVPKFGVVVSKLPATIIDISLNHYEAYDKDRLPFVVDVNAFFRITDFAIAASRIPTLAELYDQLTSIVQGAVRSILAKEYLEDIMSKRSEYGELFSKEVEPQLKEWGVMSVKNIELMDIKDAGGEEVISNIMMKKKSAIEMERRVEVAKNTKTAQESEILARQEIELKKQDADREVGLRAAAVQQEVGIAQEKQRQEVQAQAKITAEKEMEVKEVNEVRSAEIAKRAAMVKAEHEKEVTIIQVNTAEVAANTEKKIKVVHAEAEKAEQILKAEAEKEQVELKADADLKAATNEAKGIKLKGESEASAKELMEKAQIAGQIELFDKVNKDEQYQQFIIEQRKVEAMERVGIEQAKNLENADIKIFANGNSVQDGVQKAAGLLSSNTGFNIGEMLEALANTPMGKELLDKFLKPKKD